MPLPKIKTSFRRHLWECLNTLSIKFAATNSREPANMVKLIIKGYQNEKPKTFIYMPYVKPINQNPANIGMVYGKAALNAFFTYFPS